MAYFLSPALVELRRQINLLYPTRDKTSDGWIGDTSHQARKSDHNPDYSDGGIVRAIDVDEDLRSGPDAWSLVYQIVRDPRVAYVIYEGRIWQNPAVYRKGGWSAYGGANPHSHHFHVSVRHGRTWDRDSSPWNIYRTISNGGGIIGGDIPNVSPTGPITPVIPKDWFDMATQQDLANVVNAVVSDRLDRLTVEVAHIKTKVSRLDPRFITFRLADGRGGVAVPSNLTYVIAPTERDYERLTKDLLGLLALSGTLAVTSWEELASQPAGTPVSDPSIFGSQLPWENFIAANQPAV